MSMYNTVLNTRNEKSIFYKLFSLYHSQCVHCTSKSSDMNIIFVTLLALFISDWKILGIWADIDWPDTKNWNGAKNVDNKNHYKHKCTFHMKSILKECSK